MAGVLGGRHRNAWAATVRRARGVMRGMIGLARGAGRIGRRPVCGRPAGPPEAEIPAMGFATVHKNFGPGEPPFELNAAT
jgi:hypothetical protein